MAPKEPSCQVQVQLNKASSQGSHCIRMSFSSLHKRGTSIRAWERTHGLPWNSYTWGCHGWWHPQEDRTRCSKVRVWLNHPSVAAKGENDYRTDLWTCESTTEIPKSHLGHRSIEETDLPTIKQVRVWSTPDQIHSGTEHNRLAKVEAFWVNPKGRVLE